jgi:hypothetical protein
MLVHGDQYDRPERAISRIRAEIDAAEIIEGGIAPTMTIIEESDTFAGAAIISAAVAANDEDALAFLSNADISGSCSRVLIMPVAPLTRSWSRAAWLAVASLVCAGAARAGPASPIANKHETGTAARRSNLDIRD